MDETTRIGPFTFRLRETARADVSLPPLRELLALGDVPVHVAELGGANYLVVDHRGGGDDGPARVELWECETRAEGEIAGLLALCDARGEPVTPSSRLKHLLSAQRAAVVA